MQHRSLTMITLCFWGIIIGSCKKFLDAKPSRELSTPGTITDMQLLLDNYADLNSKYPKAAEICSDDYYLLSGTWEALTNQTDRNLYLWKKDGNTDIDWNNAYKAIATANIVLDGLKDITLEKKDNEAYNSVYGSALFYRAYYFYGIAQLFAKPYNEATADADLGIPLRTTSDFNVASVRATIQETYDRILSDFKEAAKVLPASALVKSRPAKPAAYGAIARTYLVMQQYDSAAKYAQQYLDMHSALLDYNDLDSISNAPIEQFNKEVVFQLLSPTSLPLANTRAKIDSNLYQSYDQNDLRRVMLFKKNTDETYQFKGDYKGSGTSSGYVFAGIVTDEIYLILAECEARSGKVELAMNTLNTLLEKRWKAGTFTPLSAADTQEALTLILKERRKELIRRGTRWSDLRRLKDDPGFSVTPQRIINGETFSLTPDSEGYVLQIPEVVITRSGMSQN